jgi:hypothetical protein
VCEQRETETQLTRELRRELKTHNHTNLKFLQHQENTGPCGCRSDQRRELEFGRHLIAECRWITVTEQEPRSSTRRRRRRKKIGRHKQINTHKRYYQDQKGEGEYPKKKQQQPNNRRRKGRTQRREHKEQERPRKKERERESSKSSSKRITYR